MLEGFREYAFSGVGGKSLKAKIIGAGGYGGVGIAELLLRHPEVEIACLVGVGDVGVAISKLYPHLAGYLDMPISAAGDAEASEPVDIVFTATPDGVGMSLAADELSKGAKMIDYSGDFRFNSADAYADYAQRMGREPGHAAPELLAESVYGLAELHRKDINADARLVGNPGCFAVSCILGLAPAVKNGLVSFSGLVCDCKTGVSGAGKQPNAMFHYPARYDSMNAYKLGGHQHVCEIEKELGALAGRDVKVTFTAQVVPVCRGIMSTLYGDITEGVSEQDVLSAYRDAYDGESFVTVYDSQAAVASVHVRGTNRCNLVVTVDERTGKLRVVSYIDNLVKGQAGSALQNMNLLLDLPETMGLDNPGMYP